MCILFFILPPIVSLPFLLIAIYQRKKYALPLFALWLGIFAMLLPPGGDAYQHNRLYFDFANNVDDLSRYIRFDFLFQTALYLCAKLSIPFGCFRCLWVFTTYNTCFSLFRKAADQNPSLQRSSPLRFLAFLLVFGAISITQTVSGMRFMFAASMLAAGVYAWVEEKRLIPSLIFIAIAGMTHFSLWVFLLLMPIIYLPFFRIPKIVLLILFLVGIQTSVLLEYITEGLTFMDTQTEDYMSLYVTGKWAEDFLTEASIEYQIYRWLTVIAFFINVLVLSFCKNTQKQWENALLLFAVTTSFFFATKAVFFRYSYFLLIIFSAYFVRYLNWKKNFILRRLILVLCAILYLQMAMDMYSFLRPKHTRMGYLQQILYMPAAATFFTEYDERWLVSYRLPDGAAIWDE